MATVICANCGGENNVTKRGGQECTYCGSMLQYPQTSKTTDKNQRKSGSVSYSANEFILPLQEQLASREGVIYELRKFLISTDSVPVDIFDHLEIHEIEWMYLPMVRFVGNVVTDWSCNQVVERKREVGKRPVKDYQGNIKYYESQFETYDDYVPISGRGHGYFDILMPCGKGVDKTKGLEDCYYRINTSVIDASSKEAWPSQGNVIPQDAIVDTDLIDVASDKDGILNDVANVAQNVAKKCSFGNYDRITDAHFTYTNTFGGKTGELYYVPFVKVIYSYRGDSHEWLFMQSPNVRIAKPTMPVMGVNDNPLKDMQRLFRDQRRSLSRQDTWSTALSFIFTVVIGMIVYYIRTNQYVELATRRLNTQIGLVSLMFKLKRQENLRQYGIEVEIDHDNRQYVDKFVSIEDESLYDHNEQPTTVAEIEEYIEETEQSRRMALRKIRGFWWGVVFFYLLVGGCIGCYCYMDNIRKEKMWAKEEAEREAREQELYDEISAKFNAEMVGNQFVGSDFSYLHRYMRIKLIDSSTLEYQLGAEGSEYDANFHHVVNWDSRRIVPYKLYVNRNGDNYRGEKTECYLVFDGYKTSNLIEEYGNGEFAKEFRVPVDKDKTELYHDMYHLERQK